jgi:hypothetical protein
LKNLVLKYLPFHEKNSATFLKVTLVNFNFFKPFKEPRNRFPGWRAGTTTLYNDVPARQATVHRLAKRFLGIDSLGSLNVYKLGTGHRGGTCCEKIRMDG